MFSGFSKTSAVECGNTTIIKDIQFSIQNSYTTPDPNIILQKGYLGNSGAIYYAATAGSSTAVFSKESANRNLEWVKAFTPFPFYHQSFVVTSDETSLFF